MISSVLNSTASIKGHIILPATKKLNTWENKTSNIGSCIYWSYPALEEPSMLLHHSGLQFHPTPTTSFNWNVLGVKLGKQAVQKNGCWVWCLKYNQHQTELFGRCLSCFQGCRSVVNHLEKDDDLTSHQKWCIQIKMLIFIMFPLLWKDITQ